jgi:ferric-dicitrate binding protein FerR (iron transport regulator)
MPQPNTNIDGLIIKYLQQTLTEAEHDKLEAWITASDENRLQFEELTNQQYISQELDKLYSYDEAKGWKSIERSFNFSEQPVVKNLSQSLARVLWINWRKAIAAAVIILLAGCGYFLLTLQRAEGDKHGVAKTNVRYKNDVAPGGNKAVLTLANGSTIVLDDAQNGAVAQQGNTKVLKFNGKLAYEHGNVTSEKILYNTISTPRGGQYQITLADGTAVWLNAASSLHFPTAFEGKERRVEITGEAYFEVAKNKARPFIVSINGAEVQVLGTHFNVMAYNDEVVLKTTLLEGSVKFIKDQIQTILKPGQQSQLTKSGQIKVVRDIDVEEVIAWKNGLFNFNGLPLKDAMRQLERWYNIETVYEDNLPSIKFYGEIGRDLKLSQVLKGLSGLGIKFRMDAGNRLVVSKG